MKFMPHDYQRYCITRIIQEEFVALFLDMGLGKTVITLTAVCDLIFNRFLVNRCLVIAPKKVAEDTWTREQDKWDHLKLLRIRPVLGSRDKRIRELNSPGNIFLFSAVKVDEQPYKGGVGASVYIDYESLNSYKNVSGYQVVSWADQGKNGGMDVDHKPPKGKVPSSGADCIIPEHRTMKLHASETLTDKIDAMNEED